MSRWSKQQAEVLDSVKLELDLTEVNLDNPSTADYAADVISRLCREYFGIEFSPEVPAPVRFEAWEFVAKCLTCHAYVSFPTEAKREEWSKQHRSSTGHNVRLFADIGGGT